jgi:hypothetical protein
MKHIGKVFEYLTSDDNKRIATCKKIEFHQLLGKPIFIGMSPFGNEVKLSNDEIHRWR